VSTRAVSRAPDRGDAASVDPILLEIINNALSSAADEMALMVLRSAYSPIVRDSMDYSTALCDRFGHTISQGLTLPIHLGSFPDMMARMMARFGNRMRPGDMFIANDPYGSGGMHLPDVFLVKPIFRDGQVEAFAATIVHHADIGGMAPGSMALHATDIFQEGLRIPTLKLFDAGEPNEEVFALLESNSRMPIELLGDLRAQIAACNAGERGILKLIDKYGVEMFRRCLAALHDYAERIIRQEIAAMPDGAHDAVDFIDGLGESGEPIRFQVRITVRGDQIEIDWAGTSPQVDGAINGPIATTNSMAFMAVRAAIAKPIPNCAGYMRAITVRAPEGTIVNPRPPAACAARGILAYRMMDVLFLALGKFLPDRIPASGEGGPSAVSLSGRKGAGHWLITDGILGSWGGRPNKDGMEGIANPAANLSNQPIELIEARLPLRIESYGFVANSGGPGRHRGGLAMERSYRVLAEEAGLTVRSDRRRFLPPGLAGGSSGTPSLNLLSRDGETRLLPVMPMQTLALRRGDAFRHIAPGAGGYGDPLERNPEKVLADVLDELIDAEYAEAVYGVAIDRVQQRVDAAATAELRKRLGAAKSSPAANDPNSAAHLAHFHRRAGHGVLANPSRDKESRK
jgi:N-methylhydantoinase B